MKSIHAYCINPQYNNCFMPLQNNFSQRFTYIILIHITPRKTGTSVNFFKDQVIFQAKNQISKTCPQISPYSFPFNWSTSCIFQTKIVFINFSCRLVLKKLVTLIVTFLLERISFFPLNLYFSILATPINNPPFSLSPPLPNPFYCLNVFLVF